MEKKILILLFALSILMQVSYSQLIRMHSRLAIAGIVVDAEDATPMSYVNIYIKHSRKGTITDNYGYFLLFSNIGDTIIFSSIGYEKLIVVANDTLGDIAKPAYVEMKKTVYELNTVNIIALRRYQQFKYEIINMKPPSNDFINAKNNFPIKPDDIDYYTRQGNFDFGLVFSPITALYDMFSKEGKEKRKLAQLEEEYELLSLVRKKYNSEVISRITGLSNEESKNFMEWMDLPVSLILSANEYQLIELIIIKYEKYQKIK